MAYQNYYPATYQNPFQQSFYQPQYQQQPVQQIQQNGIIWVSGDDEAIAYPIAPNNAVRLWHSSLPIVYFKSADASGKPTIKAYDLVERTQNSVSSQQSKVTDFATKSDLEALSLDVDAIKNELKAMRKKKREVDEDDE